MLSCKEITEKSSAYVDGDLSLRERLQYRLHLMMCHHCRTFVHNFKAGVAMLRRVRQASTHDEQVEKVCRHVHSLPHD